MRGLGVPNDGMMFDGGLCPSVGTSSRTRTGEALRRTMRTVRPPLSLKMPGGPDAAGPPGGIAVGHVLGNYRVVRLIGEGAVGRVYEVEHTKLGRRMAIKLLHADAGSDEAVVRFFNEARLVNEIRHPNIVDIEDFVSTPTGEHYLLMELLVGEDLGAAIARERSFAPARVAAIGEQLASALAAVHRKSLVYRDVKPDNVYLHRHGGTEVCKLLDFGVANIVGQRHGTATAIGAPEYMAPEQILAVDRVDARCDIYALGMLMYACLTGQPAFTTANTEDILLAQCREPVVPPSQRSGRTISPALEAVVMTCLEKEPAHRYASADEVREALHAITRAEVGAPAQAAIELEPRPAPRRPRRGGLVMMGVALAVAAAALVLTLRPSEDGDARATPATADLRPAGGAAPVTPHAPPPPRASEPPAPAEPPEPPAASPPGPAAEPTASDDDDPAIATMALSLTSIPGGAELFLGAERTPLGRAGTTAEVPLSTQPITVVARFDDGSEVTQTIVPDRPAATLAFTKKSASRTMTRPGKKLRSPARSRPAGQDKVGHDDTMDPYK